MIFVRISKLFIRGTHSIGLYVVIVGRATEASRILNGRPGPVVWRVEEEEDEEEEEEEKEEVEVEVAESRCTDNGRNRRILRARPATAQLALYTRNTSGRQTVR